MVSYDAQNIEILITFIPMQIQIWEEVGDSLEKRDREIKRNATKRQIAKSSKK